MLSYIDRFGLGVLGRAPGAGELKRMVTAENIVRAYREREKAENWVAWAQANPELAKALELGARLTNGE
jgi:hypothetical protein